MKCYWLLFSSSIIALIIFCLLKFKWNYKQDSATACFAKPMPGYLPGWNEAKPGSCLGKRGMCKLMILLIKKEGIKKYLLDWQDYCLNMACFCLGMPILASECCLFLPLQAACFCLGMLIFASAAACFSLIEASIIKSGKVSIKSGLRLISTI